MAGIYSNTTSCFSSRMHCHIFTTQFYRERLAAVGLASGAAHVACAGIRGPLRGTEVVHVFIGVDAIEAVFSQGQLPLAHDLAPGASGGGEESAGAVLCGEVAAIEHGHLVVVLGGLLFCLKEGQYTSGDGVLVHGSSEHRAHHGDILVVEVPVGVQLHLRCNGRV